MPAVAQDIGSMVAVGGVMRSGYDTLYLAVTLNQRPLSELVPVYQRDGTLYVDRDGLSALGLAVPAPTPLLALERLSGVTLKYRPSEMALSLQVPSHWLRPGIYPQNDEHLKPLTPAPPLPGVQLNYNLYTTRADLVTTANLWTRMRVLGGDNRTLTSSMQTVWADDRRKNIRLDTTFQQDFPDSLVTLSVGDTVTSGLDWTRPTRIGGLRLSRNFDLAPDQSTAPMAVFAGKAVLPSTVDVYVNNIRQASQPVAPGDFSLSGIPLQDGQGHVSMVMTDINGRKSTYTYDVYGASPLLRAHLLDASIEGGVIRDRWGEDSTGYVGSPLVSGSLRYGITDKVTVESHLESHRRVQQTGVGGRWLLGGRYGVAHASVAVSHAPSAQNGHGIEWGYAWQARNWHLSFNMVSNSSGFRDVASTMDVAATMPVQSRQVFMGTSTGIGDLSLGRVDQTEADRTTHRYSTLSWSRQWGTGTYTLSFSHQSGGASENTVMLSGVMALNARLSLNSSVTATRSPAWVTSLSQRTAQDEGSEWQVRQARYVQGQQDVQAEFRYRHHDGDVSLGVMQTSGAGDRRTTTYGTVDGSVTVLPAGVFLSRSGENAFTLVSTDGVPQIPVLLENNVVGRTNAQGYFLIDNLMPYQRNRVAIDATDVPVTYTVGQTSREVVPMRHNGALSRFDIVRHVAVQLRLQDLAGRDVAVGSRVQGRSTTSNRALAGQVGYDGVVYLLDPDVHAPLWVDEGSRRCRVVLTRALLASAAVLPQPVVCRPAASEVE